MDLLGVSCNRETAMTDKIPREMSDKGTLRDPSKMVSNSHRLLYAAVAALTFVGITVYSVTNTPTQTPPATATP